MWSCSIDPFTFLVGKGLIIIIIITFIINQGLSFGILVY